MLGPRSSRRDAPIALGFAELGEPPPKSGQGSTAVVGDVDRRVEARSEQSGARAWCLESPLRELRKGGLERERPNTRERNTANPCRLHDLENYR